MSWLDRAACKGKTDVMYPVDQGQAAEAKRTCITCHVQYRCLTYVLEDDLRMLRAGMHDDYLNAGIWAGTTKGERRVMIQEQWGL